MTQEEELIRRAVAGESRAFGILVSPLTDKFRYRALRAAKCPDEADDIVQQALLNAFRKLSSFRMECKFSTWFYAIGTNCIRMHLRTKSRVPTMIRELDNPDILGRTSLLGETPHTGIPDELLNNAQQRRVLERLIPELPENYTTVLRLQVLDNLSHKEIEQETGLSVPTVKTRLLRAKRMLINICSAA